MTWVKDKPAKDWIEENHPNNGVFRVYWKDVITTNWGGATLNPDEGEGLRYEWEYKDGERADGISRGWHTNGQLESEVTFKDGNLNGLYIYWYDNGQKRMEGTYKNNEEDGVWTYYRYENGQKSVEETFKDGLLDGLRTRWDQKGNIREETTYKDGEITR